MPTNIKKFPLHLGLMAKVFSEPEFTGLDWYQDYSIRHESDAEEGRLVSVHTFDQSWDSWEKHPHGDELVLCLEGEITLIQELAPNKQKKTLLKAYEYAINPKNIWHTADAKARTTVLFITAGMGTQHKAR